MRLTPKSRSPPASPKRRRVRAAQGTSNGDGYPEPLRAGTAARSTFGMALLLYIGWQYKQKACPQRFLNENDAIARTAVKRRNCFQSGRYVIGTCRGCPATRSSHPRTLG